MEHINNDRQYVTGRSEYPATDLCRLIMEHSNDMIIASDRNLAITLMNKVAEDKLKCGINEAQGKSLFYLFPEAKYSHNIMQHLEAVLDGRSIIHGFRSKKMHQYFEWKVLPLHDKRNQVTGVLFIIRDISVTVRQENEIGELNRALLEKQLLLNNRARMAETIIDASNDLIMILDKNLVLSTANKALLQCCGKTAEDLKGKPLFVCFPQIKDAEMHLKIKAALDGTPSWIRNMTDLVKDRHFDVFITPFSFHEMVYGVLIIAHRLPG